MTRKCLGRLLKMKKTNLEILLKWIILQKSFDKWFDGFRTFNIRFFDLHPSWKGAFRVLLANIQISHWNLFSLKCSYEWCASGIPQTSVVIKDGFSQFHFFTFSNCKTIAHQKSEKEMKMNQFIWLWDWEWFKLETM